MQHLCDVLFVTLLLVLQYTDSDYSLQLPAIIIISGWFTSSVSGQRPLDAKTANSSPDERFAALATKTKIPFSPCRLKKSR